MQGAISYSEAISILRQLEVTPEQFSEGLGVAQETVFAAARSGTVPTPEGWRNRLSNLASELCGEKPEPNWGTLQADADAESWNELLRRVLSGEFDRKERLWAASQLIAYTEAE